MILDNRFKKYMKNARHNYNKALFCYVGGEVIEE